MVLVEARKSVLRNCLTCPLCDHLMERPTAVSVCNHAFCRKCIYGKIVDEEGDCCPLCNIKLGRVPSEKLREDHALQNMVTKLLHNRRNTKSPELSVMFPHRLKERSLSSLDRSIITLTREVASVRQSQFSPQECIESKEDTLHDLPDSLYIPENNNKISQDGCQIFPHSELSNHLTSKTWPDEIYTPLAEKAHKTKLLNDLTETSTSSHRVDANISDTHFPMPQSMGHTVKSSVQDDGNSTDHISSTLENKMKGKKRGRKRRVTFQNQEVTDQDAVAAANAQWKIHTGPIWFTLMASEKQGGHTPLPQISPSYLRIKEGKMPILFIQKYIVKKLSLTDETEVEIMCLGEPILPTMQLDDLLHWWLKRTSPSSNEMQVILGTSAEDFIMVLHYGRKSWVRQGAAINKGWIANLNKWRLGEDFDYMCFCDLPSYLGNPFRCFFNFTEKLHGIEKEYFASL